ncbi:PREDICTED: F-box/WD repeat-containing protein 10-like [Chrysochloris asiatica]|uniref:F-box/WD repeat-containing protein 10-like n=1 Tax=Chrysochloris asiatica TaxID=185453 RepID=A0A9B0X3P0_CHRAS|nr:PREDICTED: F-box/WD repeat-containing protein 10-like [Chrysochloris asiatica]
MENSRFKNAPYFSCEKVCQKCETCILAWKIFSTKEWFLRISEVSQRRFLVSILKQLDSLYLLHYFQDMLQLTQGKAFIYSRSRIHISKKEGKLVKFSLNQMLEKTVEQKMNEMLSWFVSCTPRTKRNYTLSLLQMCEPRLLLTAADVVRVLRERNSVLGLEKDSTDVFFFLEKDCNLQSEISHIHWATRTRQLSFPQSKSPGNESSSENVGEEAFIPEEQWMSSLQCIAELNKPFSRKPSVTKAGGLPLNLLLDMDTVRDLSSGFSQYRDFICLLPVHISKYILSMLGWSSVLQVDELLRKPTQGKALWDIDTGKCLKTVKHKDPIFATRINDTYIVSSCERGMVKVWHVATAQLVKTLSGHDGAVKCLCFDQWHLLSGSADGLVMAWSMVGKYERCLMAFKHPKLSDQLLLTVNALQQAHSSGSFAYPGRPKAQVIDAQGPSISHSRKFLSFKGKSLQHAVEELRTSNPTTGVKKTTVPLEIQKLKPILKNSLHSSRIQSTIPQPMIIRPRLSGSFKGKDRVPSCLEGAARSAGHLTSMHVIRQNRMAAPRVDTVTQSLKKERPHFYTALNPFRMNTGFRLLTTKEEKEYREAKMKEYQASEPTVVVDPEKASKTAWLRKIKGLPIDDYKKQGKIAAPELGQNTFI